MRLLVLRSEHERERALEAIRALNLESQTPWGVWIAPYEKLRSRAQNARLWALYRRIAEATGYEAQEIHDLMRQRFLGRTVREVMGTHVETLRSTTQLSIHEMNAYMEAIERFAAEAGVVL